MKKITSIIKEFKENDFKKEYFNSLEYINWLNSESRKGNDFMLIVSDLFEYETYPIFCTSDLLHTTIEKYDDLEHMSRVDIVIKLKTQKELEKEEKIKKLINQGHYYVTPFGETVITAYGKNIIEKLENEQDFNEEDTLTR